MRNLSFVRQSSISKLGICVIDKPLHVGGLLWFSLSGELIWVLLSLEAVSILWLSFFSCLFHAHSQSGLGYLVCVFLAAGKRATLMILHPHMKSRQWFGPHGWMSWPHCLFNQKKQTGAAPIDRWSRPPSQCVCIWLFVKSHSVEQPGNDAQRSTIWHIKALE